MNKYLLAIISSLLVAIFVVGAPVFARITNPASPSTVQTPWVGNVDGGGFNLTNVGTFGVGTITVSTLSTLTGFSDGSILFATSSGDISQDTFFLWEDTTNRLTIGTSTQSEASSIYALVSNAADHAAIFRAASGQTAHIFMIEDNSGTDLFTVSTGGETEVLHTATEDGDHALHIESDAAGFGGVNGLFLDYDTGALADGEEADAILLTLDRFDSIGGDVHGVRCLATTGSALAHCLSVGVGVKVFEQGVGTFGNMDSATTTAGGDVLAAFISTSTNVTIFASDNDVVDIGDAARFTEIEFILATEASGGGVSPTFEFSTGVGTFTAFSPTDGTNGMRDSGIITWELADIGAWATGASSEFIIRITRTRNTLSTAPIESRVQISASTIFFWDEDAFVEMSSLNVSGTSTFAGETTLAVVVGTVDFGGATSIEIVNGTSPTVNVAGEIAIDTTDDQLIYFGGSARVLAYEKSACLIIESLAAADDNFEIFMANDPITVTTIGVHCRGTCTTTANVSLEDRSGNAMTHTTATSSTGTANTTYISVTSGGGLVAGEGLAFDVDNTPNPETDAYSICFTYTVDAQ